MEFLFLVVLDEQTDGHDGFSVYITAESRTRLVMVQPCIYRAVTSRVLQGHFN